MRVRPGASFWVALACVALALGVAQPAIFTCVPGAGLRSCHSAFNNHGSTSDWRYFAEAWEAARVSLADFHQFPSWNPYHCGGLVLFQDPQSPFPGPLFLLTFWWLPTAAAMKVWVIAHLLAGTFGARALVRDRGANPPEQILAAALVGACGFVTWHTGGGHLSFTPFLLFPWILWAFRRALRDARWAVLLAALFALAFLEGGTYPVPLMLVGLGIDIVARLGSADDRRAMLVPLALFGLLFPLLAGARLLPVLHYLGEHPRLVPLDDQMTLGEVWRTWVLPMHERAFPGHPYVWDEFADYVGIVPVALLLAGVAVALIRRDGETRLRRLDLALLAVLIWCALGNIPGPSLFGLLHELPIYKSLRVPSRFLGPTMVAFALVVTSALMAARRTLDDRGAADWARRAFVGVELGLTLLISVDLCVTNAHRMQQGLDPPLPRHPRASADFYQATGTDYGRFPTHPQRGVGTRQCYVPLDWKPAPGIVDGKVAQQWLEPATAGEVKLTAWSPNVVVIDGKLRAPAVVVVNQNYETGWRASTGEIGALQMPQKKQWLRSAKPPVPPSPVEPPPVEPPPVGLLSVALPAGDFHLVLRHSPPGLRAGLAMMLLGIALAVTAIRGLTPARLGHLRGLVAARMWRRPRPGGLL